MSWKHKELIDMIIANEISCQMLGIKNDIDWEPLDKFIKLLKQAKNKEELQKMMFDRMKGAVYEEANSKSTDTEKQPKN